LKKTFKLNRIEEEKIMSSDYWWFRFCSMPTISLCSMKKILVFVVRHGEREDEALYHHAGGSGDPGRTAYRKLSREDRIDPSLTAQGHRQAATALENLVTALAVARVERVSVFSSPLKRAVGTVMMLASAIQATQRANRETTTINGVVGEGEEGCGGTDYSGVSFRLPISDTREESEGLVMDSTSVDGVSADATATTVPVVIHNGLCDCTAMVGRLGGHNNVIRAGFLPCAATPENSINNTNSPLRKELVAMTDRAVQALENVDYDYINSPFLQFWKIQDETLAPMTQPLRLIRNDLLEEEQQSEGSQSGAMVRSVVPDAHESPIDHVVRMALIGGCDACVVSSHREEIRDLAEKRCRLLQELESIAYCAIGLFEAWIEQDVNVETNEHDQDVAMIQPLQWALHNIAEPDDARAPRVSEMLFHSTKVSPKSVEISWPVIERTMLCLCEARLVLDDRADESSVVGIHSCILMGADQKSRIAATTSMSKLSSITLELQITKGRHSWLTFLRRLRDGIAFGTIELEITGRANPSKHSVYVRPDQQPPLPCPPKTITLEVQL
jgi:Histidine phosphatase superfamily (branch 1)